MKKIILLIVLVFCFSCKEKEVIKITKPFVESNDIQRVEPPNWWVGFKNTQLQLIIKHPNISEAKLEMKYQGVSINKINKANSPNYMFVDLKIDETAKAGKFNLVFKLENNKDLIQTYELKSREKPSEDYLGFNSSDAIYLITPDRFSNADETNDVNKNLKETTIDRTHGYKRHGGDLQGIINGVDYISDLGFTAIWPTPVLLNDMPQGSYHGYAITDYYQVDPRFGTLENYKSLADKLRKKEMKLIMDQVANHCGLEHWWMKDLPFDDWVNNQSYYEKNKENWSWKTVKQSNHRRTTNQDLYSSELDKEGNTDGWFVATMPDLNQRNPFMAKYIIQNSIWWIETLGLGGIRQDTYPYPDKDFMADWAGAIMTEYPNFSIVGEEWSYNPLLISYWQKGNNNKDGYESNLKSTMDFAMQRLIVEGLSEEESWGKGLVKLYEGLANDFAYASPKDITIFPDNHDMSRIFTQFNGDVVKTKMALAYMLVLPRIPQIYYGTEILMDDFEKPGDHGIIRTDFPGGWQGDAVSAFTGLGLSDRQKDMQQYVKKVLNYRKTSKAIHEGSTVHFAPEKGVYVLFRVLKDEVVTIILNKNKEPYNLNLSSFSEIGLEKKTVRNIITNESFMWKESIQLNSKGVTILTTL